jgi:hypothetical protein
MKRKSEYMFSKQHYGPQIGDCELHKVPSCGIFLVDIGPSEGFVVVQSLRVNLKSGAAMIAKFLMCVLKKLQRPTKDLIVLTSVGGFAFLIALSLFFQV